MKNNKSYSHVRYLYLRDQKGYPHTCIAVQLDRSRDVINYQYAVQSSNEGTFVYRNALDVYGHFIKSPFIKKRARFIACQRLNKSPCEIEMSLQNASSHEITQKVMEKVAEDAPTRAKQAAKQWLKFHSDEYGSTQPSIPVAPELTPIPVYDSERKLVSYNGAV